MIADILNLILSRLKSEYDQYAFMSVSKDYWQMGIDWRHRNFTFVVNGVKIPMAPYIKRISLGRTIGCDICVPEVELLSLRLAMRISECDNNMGAIIVAKIDRIREYVKMLKNYGAHIEDPLNSRILVASSTCKPHYDYCKEKFNIAALTGQASAGKLFCEESSKRTGFCIENKVIITTQSYLKTIIGKFKDDNYPWMIVANDDFVVKNKVFISNDITQDVYDIRAILLIESIKPTINITYARGFNHSTVITSIKTHADKYGDSLILSSNSYKVGKYENIHINDGDINIDNTRNMPRTNKLYHMKSPPTNRIPVDNIICSNNDINRYKKIFTKTSKYRRTLNILCIYSCVENYIRGTIKPNYIEKYVPNLLKSDIIVERANMFALFGVDIFELGKFEQYVLFYSFPKDRRRTLPHIWARQCDNKLSAELFTRFLDNHGAFSGLTRV